MFFLLRNCKLLKRIISCVVVSFNVSLRSTFADGLSFSLFCTNFALRFFVDDHELGDVSVSLFTVQLRCAFASISVPFCCYWINYYVNSSLSGDCKTKLT